MSAKTKKPISPKLIAVLDIDSSARIMIPRKLRKLMGIKFPASLAFFYDEKTKQGIFTKADQVSPGTNVRENKKPGDLT